jgi:peptide/nickel transport system permease protein
MLLRRLSLYAVTLWVAITVTFLLPRLMPGNPVQTMIGKITGSVTPQQVRAIELSFGIGLHQGLVAQYLGFWHQLFIGNLGVSITSGQNVSTALVTHVPWTVGLIGISTVVSFLVGTLSGALLGWFRGSRLDSLIPMSTFLQAAPYFFLATVVQLIFALNLHLFPAQDSYNMAALSPGWHWDFIFSALRYGELPMITVVLSSVAGWMLGMRNMMITVIAEDYVLMAVAKGLPRRKVIMHAARNAVLPSVANLSLAIGLVVSGALLVELVFNYYGVGSLLLNAVLDEDYPLIQGLFLVITVTVLAANLIADVFYFILDPRTRTEAAV